MTESGERNHSDLRREFGRLFVLLSNSPRNLHGCWQPNVAWKGLCLYLSTQWDMFSTGSVVNLCSVNSLTCTSPNLDGVLITVPSGNRLDKAKLSLEKLVNYERVYLFGTALSAHFYPSLFISECLCLHWEFLFKKSFFAAKWKLVILQTDVVLFVTLETSWEFESLKPSEICLLFPLFLPI